MIEKIREIICICVAVEPEDITPESKLLSNLGFTSLDLAVFATEIEKEFGKAVPVKPFASARTVGGIIEYLSKE